MENLHSTKNQCKRTLKQLFNAIGKLNKDQNEIQGMSVINWQQQSWQKTTLLIDMAVQLSNAKTDVFSDSVLCMEGSVKIPSKLGRRRSIDFRVHFNIENWMESMGSRWSSSGQFSQDSPHCKSSPRFKT